MIAVIDYGMGNLRSVQKALQHEGGDARIISNPTDLACAEKIVLPGVGAFEDAIARLRENHMDSAILDAIYNGTPFLGICLGFQLLFDISYENGRHTGLGVFPGKIVKFGFVMDMPASGLKVPHMGWNRINLRSECPLFNGIDNFEHVYFVHSYHAVTLRNEVVSAVTDYGYGFTSAVWQENIFATQFHPEKSQATGLKMLNNFIRY
jgi:glutamine amidotransferase